MESLYCFYYWNFGKKQAVSQVYYFKKFTTTFPKNDDKLECSSTPDFNDNYLTDFDVHEVNESASEKHEDFVSENCQGYNENSDIGHYERLKWAIITHKSVQVISTLMEKDLPKKMWLQVDHLGDNLLHIATRHEHVSAVEYLLSLGVNGDSKNFRGDTPLHLTLLCSTENFTKLVRIFVENGADLNCVDDCGNSYAHLCASHLKPEQYITSVNCLINLGYSYLFRQKNDLNQTPLHIAVLTGLQLDWETLKHISTSSGYDFNEGYSEGDTLLHYAARWTKRRDMLEYIVELGGDPDLRNNYQKTVLHCAAAGSNTEAISYFISLGAELNARDFLGRTPLHHLQFAKEDKLIDLTNLLLKAGADVYAADDCGNTVAHHVSSKVSGELYAKWTTFINEMGHDKLFSLKNRRELLLE